MMQRQKNLTMGKQLSNGVTRFDVNVRLTGYMHDTCYTNLIFLKSTIFTLDFLILLIHTMAPDNSHIYQPGYPPIGPQYLQYIESLFQSQVAAIKDTLKGQLEVERLGWLKQQQEVLYEKQYCRTRSKS